MPIILIRSNKLEKLPEWIADCMFLKRLNASHNKLQCLPARCLFQTILLYWNVFLALIDTI